MFWGIKVAAIDWVEQLSFVPWMMPYTIHQGEPDGTSYYMTAMHWWVRDRVLEMNATESDLEMFSDAMEGIRSGKRRILHVL